MSIPTDVARGAEVAALVETVAAISLTRSAAMEYAPQGVRTNAVAPGRVVTGMMLGSGIAEMAQ